MSSTSETERARGRVGVYELNGHHIFRSTGSVVWLKAQHVALDLLSPDLYDIERHEYRQAQRKHHHDSINDTFTCRRYSNP